MTCEKDRINFHKTLRNMLLEEIERIEKDQQAKENEMEKWRQNFEADMEKEQDKLNAKIDNLTQEREILKNQLESSVNGFQQREKELSERVQFLVKTKEELAKKSEEAFREMNSIQQNLINQKNVTSVEGTKWETEKVELFEQVVRSNTIMEEKEATNLEKMQSLEVGYKTTLEVYDQRIRMLDTEKRLIERESSGIIDFLESKNKSSEKEINDLRNMSLFLVNTITEREEILSKEAEIMRQEISNLAIGFDNREKDYIKETRDYSEKILSLHDLLTKAQERLEQGWDPLRSVSEAFRDQVETL